MRSKARRRLLQFLLASPVLASSSRVLANETVSTIETLEASEQNVQDEAGRWLSVRIRPYRPTK